MWHEKNPVPREVAQERFRRMVEVQDAAVRAYHERKVGTTVRALVHGVSRKDPAKLSAKTTDNVTVRPRPSGQARDIRPPTRMNTAQQPPAPNAARTPAASSAIYAPLSIPTATGRRTCGSTGRRT